ncbi:MAG: hypothetical protein KAY65_03305 [Planctomycetes bacterium]|nr:hypothetical protein [Planctomycetota bacterium]
MDREVLNMKYRIYILAIAVFVAAVSNTGWSIENTAIRNPAGISTVPPSSLGSGLFRSPNPIDRSSSQVMTGNIRGGRHFTGGVPYKATTSFGSSLGSTSLDSFLRDSAGLEGLGRYSGRYTPRPFYSPTGTVSISQPGRSGIFKPVDSRVGGRIPDTFGLGPLSKKQALPRQDTSTLRFRLPSTPLTTQDTRRLAPGEMSLRPQSQRLTAEQYRRKIEQLQRDVIRMRGETPESKTDTISKEDLLKLLPEPGATETERKAKRDKERLGAEDQLWLLERTQSLRTQRQAPKEQPKRDLGDFEVFRGPGKLDEASLETLLSLQKQGQPDRAPRAGKTDVLGTMDLERIKQQIANLQQRVGKLSTTESPLVETAPKVGTDKMDLRRLDVLGKQEESPAQETMGETYWAQSGDSLLEQGGLGTSSIVDEINELSTAELSARARRIMGPHKTLRSYNQARCRQYVTSAQAYLKQGRYYQAANTFAQASIYDSKDPLANAGRSLALFAAGEYMSSALFLSRAIEASREYAGSKVDLVAMLGDRDKIESRIADAEECLQRSLAPELEFLLGYTYYRMGRLGPAKRAIDTAQKQMPKSVAVQLVRKAIDDALKSQPPKVK